jgi:transcriptional regulator with XRE-family HTH domain
MASLPKPLPESLPAPTRRLVERLREIKDENGLSLSDLAVRTHYSKASWERWLNGKRLITPQALGSLAESVACDAAELQALLDGATAASTQDGGDESTADQEPQEDRAEPQENRSGQRAPAAAATPETTTVRRRTRRQPLLLGGGLIVGAAVVLIALLGSDPGSTRKASASPSVLLSASASTGPSLLACQAVGCTGKDPQLTGCGADAKTLLTGNDGKVILYIRYSPHCQAAWARLTDGSPRDTATIITGTGLRETARINWGYDAYSPMVDASGAQATLEVCGQQPAGSACTLVLTDPAERSPVTGTPSAGTAGPSVSAAAKATATSDSPSH